MIPTARHLSLTVLASRHRGLAALASSLSGCFAKVMAPRHLGLTALAFCLSGCFAALPAPVPPPLAAVDVGTVSLQRGEAPAAARLDIGVRVFDNDYGRWGPDEDTFTEVRENEAHYLPYELRNTLTDSGQWGAVRVLPEDDPSMDLMVEGTILRSNGVELMLSITARDSTGRVWLEDTYRDRAVSTDYPDETGIKVSGRIDRRNFQDPFQDIYNRISNDLLALRREMPASRLEVIKETATLVYANDLAPDSFRRFLDTDDQARIRITALPAESDPMLGRVKDMRQRHYLFIDRVDEYYQALYHDMQLPYIVWRNHSRDEELEYRDHQHEALAALNSDSGKNGYLELIQRFHSHRWEKVQDQEFTALAAGFNTNVAPSILELNRQVLGLTGTVEEQYRQWRRILRELFIVESGD